MYPAWNKNDVLHFLHSFLCVCVFTRLSWESLGCPTVNGTLLLLNATVCVSTVRLNQTCAGVGVAPRVLCCTVTVCLLLRFL